MNILFFKIPDEVVHLPAYRKREMKIENVINRFRLGFLILIVIIDVIGYLSKDHSFLFEWNIHSALFLLLAASPLLILIHLFSRTGRYNPWLKYVSVSLDLTIVFLLTIGTLKTAPTLIEANETEFCLIMSIVFIFFSMVSVLRLDHAVIYLSAALSVIFNVWIYNTIGNFFMLGLLVVLILLLLHVFILWVSNYILQYFLLSHKISNAFDDLQSAHNQISQQHEEITTQKEEISNHLKNLETAYTELSDSIMYAKKIQNALINNSKRLQELCHDHFVFFKPKSIVSGDFYWISEVDDKIMLALADCTGHGVPGAFMTMLGTSLLNEIVNKRRITEPDEVLNKLRSNIIEALNQDGKLYQPKDGMDMVMLQIDQKRKRLVFSGANNSFCYIPHTNQGEEGRIIEFKGDRMPVSYHYKMHQFSQLTLSYQNGDQIYIFTDGYIDQFGGPKGKKFKSVPFKRMLANNSQKSLAEQRNELDKTLNYWIKHKYDQIDDITVIGIKL